MSLQYSTSSASVKSLRPIPSYPIMESTFVLLLTLAVSTIGVFFLLYRRKNAYNIKGKIPHFNPLSPIGNGFFLFMLRKTTLPKFICKIYNHFPNAKYFGIMDFNKRVIVLRDPELIKDVCVKMFDNFPDHNNFIDESIDPVWGKNVFALRGARWKEMRNTLSPSFTASKMKFMFKLISKCSLNFVDYFVEHPEEAKAVEMKDSFTRYTNDVIATAAFGISVDSMKNRNNEFYLRGKDAMDFNSVIQLIKFIFFRFCPTIMKFTGLGFMSRSTNRFFKKLVCETVDTRRQQNIIRPDMIHLLIEASDNDNGVKLSIDDIIAQAFIFFLAGFATTATLMGFIAHELAMNPEIQEKLRDEVDEFTKNGDSEISYDTLSKMKYLDMVISETLRKYPPAGVADRLCVEKYTLPKSTPDSDEFVMEPDYLIWLPIYALHHDEKYFPDPEKFDPERFSDKNKDNINPYVYIPFGVGPRKCIGNRFALMETKILFVHILQKFVLVPTEKTKHPVEFEKGFNVTVEGDFWVRFQKRVE